MTFAALLADPTCSICGARTRGTSHDGTSLCEGCVDGLPTAPRLALPEGLDRCFALTGYEGTGRDLVAALKFRGRRDVVPFAARRIARMVSSECVEVVTWAPTLRSHRRRRGFDQAEILARAVAKELVVPVRRCLVRLPGPSQTGRHREERLHGPAFDSAAGVVRNVAGRRVAIVDDVITTGATLTAAASVLRQVGAGSVMGLAIARTRP